MSLPPAMPTKDTPFPLLRALRAGSGHQGKEAARSGSANSHSSYGPKSLQTLFKVTIY